ncbi:MAG: PA14 domain-containing protein, partial [Myxococcota bacterium]
MRAQQGFEIILLCLGVGAGCLEAPSLLGRTCTQFDNPCPSEGLSCIDGRCASPSQADGGVIQQPDAALRDSGFPDAGPLDAAVPDTGTGPVDAGTGALDAGVAACAQPIAYPDEDWEVRYFVLGDDNTFGPCFGVERWPSGPGSANAVKIEWNDRAPLGSSESDFGSRITARRFFEEGPVSFIMTHDDGIRLYIDDALIYENWQHGVEIDVVKISPYLTEGMHTIRIDHFDDNGAAQVDVIWESGCTLLPALRPDQWIVKYYGIRSNGEIDLDRCYGAETLS